MRKKNGGGSIVIIIIGHPKDGFMALSLTSTMRNEESITDKKKRGDISLQGYNIIICTMKCT